MSRLLLKLAIFCLLLNPGALTAETVRIPASADIWLSHATERESDTGAGGSLVFKLKSVQELAALRFDLEHLRGREIVSARLHLRARGQVAPRWLRVSTVTSRWEEGLSTRAYSGRDGATWKHADAARGKAWAWPGSVFSDVCMGAGQSLVEVVELRPEVDAWGVAELSPDLVRAMLCGASDGLALMDGGTPRDHNYYFHSAQSWESAPWLELELGAHLGSAPPPPLLRVEPAPSQSSLQSSAMLLHVRADSTDFAFRAWLNGEAMDPFRLPRVGVQGDVLWVLKDLPPRSELQLEVRAVSPAGVSSEPSSVSFITPSALADPPPLPGLEGPSPQPWRAQAPTVWALPALTRIDPHDGVPLVPDPRAAGVAPFQANPIWDGRAVQLLGARGETISFSVIVRRALCGNFGPIRIVPGRLVSWPEAQIELESWSLRETWYGANPNGREGSYLVPVEAGEWAEELNGERLAEDHQWRCFRAELHIPSELTASNYQGELVVEFPCGQARMLPIHLEVSTLRMPPTASFRVELNAYRVPANAAEYFRLARRHRAVFTPWVVEPTLTGEAPDLTVEWKEYDELLAPLLDGSAFVDDPRPLEVLYLPFWESWPVTLSPTHYAYPEPWPAKGDPFERMWDHHGSAPSINTALSTAYLQGLRTVQRQFVDHFAARGWKATELHAFYGSKMRHLTRYGRMSFWNTDEPLYLADWQALRFFLEHFDAELTQEERAQWIPRADVSRPEWIQGALGPAARIIYIGGRRQAADARRVRQMADELGFRWMVYGAASTEEEEPVESAMWALESYLDGAEGLLVWLALGDRNSWQDQDPEEFPGTALMTTIPEHLEPVGDLRLVALREAQQLSAWMDALKALEGLERAQLDALLEPIFAQDEDGWWRGRSGDPGRNRRGALHANDLERLRRLLAERWEEASRLK